MIYFLLLATVCIQNVNAENAVKVLGKDYVFPEKISGMPKKLSDFKELEINSFKTNDGINLSYWEAGTGEPLVFVPGWSSNGAEYINLIYLLKDKYHVYVLDQRNQGLSDKSDSGIRISRYAQDLNEFINHLKLEKVYLSGWSMGAAVVWSYIDLFTDQKIKKLVLIDEAPSIYSHNDWTEEERRNAGAFTSSAEMMVESFSTGKSVNKLIVNADVFERFMKMDSPYFKNATGFANAVIKNDMKKLRLVMFDHATNDWRDVIKDKIHVPTAIFTGEHSSWLSSQQWMNKSIKGSKLYIYKGESGDHFLHLKDSKKFSNDLKNFFE